MCTKSSGVALVLANVRTPGRANFANAPASGLTRHTNAPQLPGECMGAPEIDWCITTKPRNLGRRQKIKDLTAIGCQHIHKNVISCIPIRNITAKNWQISKCYITALNKKFSIKKFYSDIELRHRNYSSDSRENQLISAPGNAVWDFCISKMFIIRNGYRMFLSAKPEWFQKSFWGILQKKKLHQWLRQEK